MIRKESDALDVTGLTGSHPKINQLIRLGLQHHTSGRLPQAEAAYRQALEKEPGHPEALHPHPEYTWNLGLVYKEMGKDEEAVAYCRRSLAVKADPDRFVHCGSLLGALGRSKEAARIVPASLGPGAAPCFGFKRVLDADAYRERFPDDRAMISLGNWHVFEQDKPDTSQACMTSGLKKPEAQLLDSASNFLDRDAISGLYGHLSAIVAE